MLIRDRRLQELNWTNHGDMECNRKNDSIGQAQRVGVKRYNPPRGRSTL